MKNAIIIRGARQNNLKNLNLDLPLNQITVITGVSGAGKSSLAFDTLYAEGQRRYVESFSAYARQFLERMDKPQVDKIEGIPPAIAINQTNPIKTSRSTLGTLTEINDYLKLLFPKLATLYCRGCNQPVEKDSAESIAKKLLHDFTTHTAVITFPFFLKNSERVSRTEMIDGLRKMGFSRIYHHGTVAELNISLLEELPSAQTAIVVDRVVISRENAKRLVDSLEMGLHFGKGLVTVFFPSDHGPQKLKPPRKFSSALHCPACDISYREPFPNLFSFNNPLGACPACNGFGKIITIDLDLIVPDPNLSLKNDAIKPWATPAYREAYYDLMKFCKKEHIPVDVPFCNLSLADRERIINGSDDFYGIKGFFDWLETKTYKMHIRVLLSKYRGYAKCPNCAGTRFQPESLLYRIQGKTIAEICALSISRCHQFFEQLAHNGADDKATRLLVEEIKSRLGYLASVGLGYLTLDRQSRTLSGGEVVRASLTTALGASLVNAFYILDEPSIGLHPRDNQRLIGILKGMRDMGNTIAVVEHDPEIIMNSDMIVDLGPRAGAEGGELVFCGKSRDILHARQSLTGRYLKGDCSIPLPATRRSPRSGQYLQIKNAAHHNLQNLTFSIPLGLLVCITGVSGSGKSTLLKNVIYQGLLKKMGRAGGESNRQCEISGAELLDQVTLMDQSPIGRTPRSNPLTYLKMFDEIRKIFAQTTEARERGYSASTFSFNTPGGRCEQCQGDGFEKIEMQFLSDVFVRCPHCQGARYTKDVLEVTYQNKNISQVLELTVSEARSFFSSSPKLVAQLELLEMVGLGYLRLGQSVNTLSGGESQRLKVASIIKPGTHGHTLFLFDEPTTGLHFDDIQKLLNLFTLLLERGHSLLVVEHNLDFIKCADHIIDLGPEGGEEGGCIVAQGTPEEIMAAPHSYTGRFLKKYLTRAVPLFNKANAHNGLEESAAPPAFIEITGAREHNLKNITLSIPREKLVVITGLSGSGKSTLAFDILFAEGQRRFLETLSPYARQYIKQLDRPEVDSLRGIPPTVAIEQRLAAARGMSTVATLTEVYHYLRLLFAKAGEQHCPSCDAPLKSQSAAEIAEDIILCFTGNTVMLLSPLVKGRKGYHKEVIEKARQEGFEKIRINGQIVNLREIFAVQRYQLHQIELVTAEFKVLKKIRACILREVEKALIRGKGTLYVATHGTNEKIYSTRRFCDRCQISLEEPDPRLFSFNSPEGACSSCSGLGINAALSPELIAPDTTRSINEGAIIPLASSFMERHLKKKIMHAIESQLHIPLAMPLQKLPKETFHALFYGADHGAGITFPGLLHILHTSREGNGENSWSQYLSQFYAETACASCRGTRLNPRALSVKLGGCSIAAVTSMTPPEARSFLTSLSFTEKQQIIASPILKELKTRLEFLDRVGLSYLTLDRRGDTLSGGEAQRIRLAAQMGSNLRGVAYILDEPTIGLHPHDNKNLLRILRSLQKRGNTLIIVEHDEETIRSADFVIDLGIGGGIHGGNVVAAGTLQDIMHSKESVTGAWLSHAHGMRKFRQPRPLDGCAYVTIEGAREHNLKHITVSIPLQRLTVVTGVSGSGKSTLVKDTVYKGIKKRLGSYYGYTGACDSLKGAEHLSRVAEIDQSPIGKTPRSTPATYIGFYSEIRRMFSLVPESQIRGFTPSRFSFNVSGGRCEKCSGQGKIKMAMSFLPDVYVLCDVCQGKRFNEETLSVRLKGKNISDVLDLTVEEACSFFQGFPAIHRPLHLLARMGLGYLTLGQQSPTLSGGEAQRIKIAYELSRTTRGNTLYVLDEPTTGLHVADIDNLMTVLQELVDRGNTMIIIEHNMEVIRQADYIIDLGPEGGDQGGFVVASGTPAEVAIKTKTSYTARYLNQYLRQKNLLSK
jgi:excinuclease ABC subunit A